MLYTSVKKLHSYRAETRGDPIEDGGAVQAKLAKGNRIRSRDMSVMSHAPHRITFLLT